MSPQLRHICTYSMQESISFSGFIGDLFQQTLACSYSSSNRLTEKSDVYSFGVVLLEIITGRPALKGNEEATHIVPWVNSMLPQGDVKMFLDPRIQDNFSLDSVWKLVELAMACVSHNAIERPTMTYAVMEIKECLAMVITHGETESDKWVRMIPTSLETSRLVPHTV